MSLREKVNLCGSRDLCWKLYSKTCFENTAKTTLTVVYNIHCMYICILYACNSVNETT